jgi:hypothetical protein
LGSAHLAANDYIENHIDSQRISRILVRGMHCHCNVVGIVHRSALHLQIVLSAATGGLVLGLSGGFIQPEVVTPRKQIMPVPAPVEKVP